MTSVQIALFSAFASSAVCANRMRPSDRPGPTAWVIASFQLLLTLSLLATLMLALSVGPWWRVPVTLLAGGVLGGTEAVILRRLPSVITVINLIATWTWLIVLYSHR